MDNVLFPGVSGHLVLFRVASQDDRSLLVFGPLESSDDSADLCLRRMRPFFFFMSSIASGTGVEDDVCRRRTGMTCIAGS